MCGVFGFVAGKHEGLDLRTIERIAIETELRGRHAFGFAWLDSRGRLKRFKAPGRISDNLGLLSLAADARILIGHCRFATHGKPENNENNHPHPCDGGWLVHNGVVGNYDRLMRDYSLPCTSDCDSEAIAQLIEEGDGTLIDRSIEAVNLTQGPLVTLGLWSRPGRLVVVKRGNPLHAVRVGHSLYLASLPGALGSKAQRILDDTARVITNHRGAVEWDTYPLEDDNDAEITGTSFTLTG